jgi:hypothetical protein
MKGRFIPFRPFFIILLLTLHFIYILSPVFLIMIHFIRVPLWIRCIFIVLLFQCTQLCLVDLYRLFIIIVGFFNRDLNFKPGPHFLDHIEDLGSLSELRIFDGIEPLVVLFFNHVFKFDTGVGVRVEFHDFYCVATHSLVE